MSAVAALAVASPFVVIAVSELTARDKPAPQQHDFVQAAQITDLPNELISALQQGLSQFGIVVPNMPSSITGSSTPSGLTSPGLTSPGLTSPGLTSPGLTPPTPGLTVPGTATPGLTPPGAAALGLTPPAATTPGLTDPSLTDPGLTNPGLTSPGLTSPTAPGLATPAGLPGAANPALTSPTGLTPGYGPGEVPINAPIGDPGLGPTYPLLGGDPSLAAAPAAPGGGGGLMNDLSSAANQLGVTQGIDLLKGVLMPSIMQAIKAGAAAPAPAPAPPPPPASG
jgi:GLTT repeat (6 copies)